MKDKMFWANTPVGHAKMITDIKNYGVWFQSGMKHAAGEKEYILVDKSLAAKCGSIFYFTLTRGSTCIGQN